MFTFLKCMLTVGICLFHQGCNRAVIGTFVSDARYWDLSQAVADKISIFEPSPQMTFAGMIVKNAPSF